MNCAQLYQRLTDLEDGALPGDVCEEVNRHLAECADCTLVRQDLEDLARLCRETAQPTTMPSELRSRVQALLANPGQSSV
jgi:predicted anti-sigma-YlaC factor YlaD